VHFAAGSDTCNGLTHVSSAYDIVKCGGSYEKVVVFMCWMSSTPTAAPQALRLVSQILLSPTLCPLNLSVLKFN